jgi:hypothetical protein
VSQPEVLSSRGPELLGSDEEEQSPRPRPVVALSTAVVAVVVLAVAGWWGGSWWHERQQSARDARVAAVSFALLDASVTNGTSDRQDVVFSALLVNTGPKAVKVQNATWDGGKIDQARGKALGAHESVIVYFSASFRCALNGSTTTLPLPKTKLSVRTFDGTVVPATVPVLNRKVWDGVVYNTCSTLASQLQNSVFPTGDPVSHLVGKVLVVRIVIANNGAVPAGPVSVTLAADGFDSTAVPATVTGLAPGAQVPVEIRVKVADCTLARTGQVDGVLVSTSGGYGADTNLIRNLDRLVAASCP